MEELLNEGLNDTGWDKKLGDFVMDCPVPAPIMTVGVQGMVKEKSTEKLMVRPSVQAEVPELGVQEDVEKVEVG